MSQIIHISGPSGAGKTTLGNRLKEKFGDEIVVKDIDDLRYEFIVDYYGPDPSPTDFRLTWDRKAYQEYIDRYIRNQDRPIIFVGLNDVPWQPGFYYDMHPDHKFYIELDADTIFRQKCSRFMDDIFVTNRNRIIDDIVRDETKTISAIQEELLQECSYSQIQQETNQWNQDYRDQGYVFLPREEILKRVSRILRSFSAIPYGPRELIASFLPSAQRYPDVYGENYVNEEADRMLEKKYPDCVGLGSGWDFYETLSLVNDQISEEGINPIEYALANPIPEYRCMVRSLVEKDRDIYIKYVRDAMEKQERAIRQENKTKQFIEILTAYEMVHDLLNTERWMRYRDTLDRKALEILMDPFIRKNRQYQRQIIELYEKIFGKPVEVEYRRPVSPR